MKYLNYIILFILLFIVIYQHNNPKVKEVTKIETVTKTDTITIYEPIKDTVYLTKYVKDTLYLSDSTKVEVNIPISTTIYTDSTYIAKISGYKAILDEITVFPKETTIYKEKTLEIEKKQSFIQHGIQVGIGYGLKNKTPDLFIGYGIQIKF